MDPTVAEVIRRALLAIGSGIVLWATVNAWIALYERWREDVAKPGVHPLKPRGDDDVDA